jgi:hypothetical protein
VGRNQAGGWALAASVRDFIFNKKQGLCITKKLTCRTYKVSNGTLTHRTASLPRAWSLDKCDITPRDVVASRPGVRISLSAEYDDAAVVSFEGSR